MRLPPESGRPADSAVLLFLFALFLLVSPFTFWWAADGSPWVLPYLIWLGLIVLIAWTQRRRGDHDL